jgi:hypothetical protein
MGGKREREGGRRRERERMAEKVFFTLPEKVLIRASPILNRK